MSKIDKGGNIMFRDFIFPQGFLDIFDNISIFENICECMCTRSCEIMALNRISTIRENRRNIDMYIYMLPME